jgi:rhodanese-related sulfurtransferase
VGMPSYDQLENSLPTRITREALQAQLAGPDGPVLVEALGSGFYADAHLPGAINIPPGQVDRLAPVLLPARDVRLVVYCTGSCSSADAVARRLEELGYTDVAVYAAGKEDWVEHGLPVERSELLDPQD